MSTLTIDTDEVSKFLTSIYGLEVNVQTTSDDSEQFGAVAHYVDGDGSPKGHIYCDLPAAAILGAALTQFPMGVVDDSLSSKTLADNLRENLEEVMNIAVNLFAGKVSGRLVLGSIDVSGENKPDLSAGTGLKVSVQRYGDGYLNIALD